MHGLVVSCCASACASCAGMPHGVQTRCAHWECQILTAAAEPCVRQRGVTAAACIVQLLYASHTSRCFVQSLAFTSSILVEAGKAEGQVCSQATQHLQGHVPDTWQQGEGWEGGMAAACLPACQCMALYQYGEIPHPQVAAIACGHRLRGPVLSHEEGLLLPAVGKEGSGGACSCWRVGGGGRRACLQIQSGVLLRECRCTACSRVTEAAPTACCLYSCAVGGALCSTVQARRCQLRVLAAVGTHGANGEQWQMVSHVAKPLSKVGMLRPCQLAVRRTQGTSSP